MSNFVEEHLEQVVVGSPKSASLSNWHSGAVGAAGLANLLDSVIGMLPFQETLTDSRLSPTRVTRPRSSRCSSIEGRRLMFTGDVGEQLALTAAIAEEDEARVGSFVVAPARLLPSPSPRQPAQRGADGPGPDSGPDSGRWLHQQRCLSSPPLRRPPSTPRRRWSTRCCGAEQTVIATLGK